VGKGKINNLAYSEESGRNSNSCPLMHAFKKVDLAAPTHYLPTAQYCRGTADSATTKFMETTNRRTTRGSISIVSGGDYHCTAREEIQSNTQGLNLPLPRICLCGMVSTNKYYHHRQAANSMQKKKKKKIIAINNNNNNNNKLAMIDRNTYQVSPKAHIC
jgi:hypothetical protein